VLFCYKLLRCPVCQCAQVDALTQQLGEAQQAAADRSRLEGSLATADRARREAEEKLAAALRHNAATARDLATLQVCGTVRLAGVLLGVAFTS
jgi:hypothetical protein